MRLLPVYEVTMYCAIEDYDAAARVLGYPSAAAFLGVPEPQSVLEIDDSIGDYPDDPEQMTPKDHVNALINCLATIRATMRYEYANLPPRETAAALVNECRAWEPSGDLGWWQGRLDVLAAIAIPVDPVVLRLLVCDDCDTTPGADCPVILPAPAAPTFADLVNS